MAHDQLLQNFLQQQLWSQQFLHQNPLLIPSLLSSFRQPGYSSSSSSSRLPQDDPTLPWSVNRNPAVFTHKRTRQDGTVSDFDDMSTTTSDISEKDLLQYVMANQLAIAQLTQVIFSLIDPDDEIWNTITHNLRPRPTLGPIAPAHRPGHEPGNNNPTNINARSGQVPWIVSVRVTNFAESTFLLCGGTIVAPTWVLTAASCLDGERTSVLQVVAGETDARRQEGTEQTRRVVNYFQHPEYIYWERPFKNDVALIQLEEPVNITEFVDVVRLPSPGQVVTDRCQEAGWGAPDYDAPGTKVLRVIDVTPVEVEECRKMYPGLGQHVLCVGDEGYGSCIGDNGAALMCSTPDEDDVMVGVMSWRAGCAEPNKPAVYMQVAHYLPWIHQIVNSVD